VRFVSAATPGRRPGAGIAFQTPTAHGPLQLSLPAPDQPEVRPAGAVRAALQLALCEPVIRALEDWLALPLDPVPVAADLPLAPGVAVLAPSGLTGLPGVRLHLPWGLVLQAAPPPEVLLTCAWPALGCEVELARYPSPPGSREALQAGHLLLPGSFEARWQVALVDPGQGLQLEATFAAPSGLIQGFEGARRWSPAAAGAPVWRVVLSQRVAVPLPQALGWQAGAVAWPSGAARLLGPGDPPSWAEGRVCPAWAGAALIAEPSN
jgi:hypothetical protein